MDDAEKLFETAVTEDIQPAHISPRRFNIGAWIGGFKKSPAFSWMSLLQLELNGLWICSGLPSIYHAHALMKRPTATRSALTPKTGPSLCSVILSIPRYTSAAQ
jgi:hypothetical protein